MRKYTKSNLEKTYKKLTETDHGKKVHRLLYFNWKYTILRKMYGAFDDICRNSMKGSDEEVINNYQLILNRCNKLITEIGGEEKWSRPTECVK